MATARGLSKQTLTSSLGECVGVEDTNEDELYDSLDWLLSRQAAIEKKLAKRHLQQGSLVLYDLTSTWVEGRSCPLAKLGYSRDGKKNKLQVVFGLLCERDGRPVGVEVFEGNTGDPAILGSQIRKVRERFELDSIVFVGDRGMIHRSPDSRGTSTGGRSRVDQLTSCPSDSATCKRRNAAAFSVR